MISFFFMLHWFNCVTCLFPSIIDLFYFNTFESFYDVMYLAYKNLFMLKVLLIITLDFFYVFYICLDFVT